ncbi:DUF2013 domain-containing protein [Flavobacterium sp. SM15]|uniref:DUF2013 domain-containing protein n=1 Tax=Flavobacterium sp. SM15 TaxID=2908005 RepID=UPI001EDAC6F0|nr:DUF2013 domain-containing protein [Flavobacterium sp. SM15]MCG2610783.1 DUF2013 domain-containing protein [Flavobacterium sp. SM15]
MENKIYTTIGIMNSEKWKQLKSYFDFYNSIYEYLDRSEPKEKTISNLQTLCFDINTVLNSTIDYLQLKENQNIINTKKRKIYIYSKDLNILLDKCVNELKSLGSNTLIDYDKFYFEHLELMPEKNKETSIYAYEIEQEFRENVKIEKETKVNNRKKDKTKENWFIIGVKFATGEIQEMLRENEPPKIAELLGNKDGYRPYITQTLSVIKKDSKSKDKNIYLRKKEDIELILEYCKKNNFEVCQDFKEKIKCIITD